MSSASLPQHLPSNSNSRVHTRPSSSPLTPSLSADSPTPIAAALPTPQTQPPLARRTAPSTPPTSKSRARDLLRKHYGLGVGPPPIFPGNVADPMNMDSPAFDAKSYYEQLITTSSLPALLRRENELITEIRQLDSERQSLVYNHHHELIAARDTIAAMKTRAEGLDSDLDLLRAAFSEISRLAAEVSMEPAVKTNERHDKQ